MTPDKVRELVARHLPELPADKLDKLVAKIKEKINSQQDPSDVLIAVVSDLLAAWIVLQAIKAASSRES